METVLFIFGYAGALAMLLAFFGFVKRTDDDIRCMDPENCMVEQALHDIISAKEGDYIKFMDMAYKNYDMDDLNESLYAVLKLQYAIQEVMKDKTGDVYVTAEVPKANREDIDRCPEHTGQ